MQESELKEERIWKHLIYTEQRNWIELGFEKYKFATLLHYDDDDDEGVRMGSTKLRIVIVGTCNSIMTAWPVTS